MKFWLGLAVGVVLGGAGTYLVTARPWRAGSVSVIVPRTETDDADGVDAGVLKKRGRHRGRASAGAVGTAESGAATTPADDVDDSVSLSASDRALEWRGDSVALPPARVDMGAGGDARPLDDGEIQRGLAGGTSAMVDCIKTAVSGADLAAEVTLEILVGADGRVQKLRVRAPAYLQDHGLLACARRAARGFSFAATGAPTVVTTPFHLND